MCVTGWGRNEEVCSGKSWRRVVKKGDKSSRLIGEVPSL